MTSWDEMSSLADYLASVKPYAASEGCPQTAEYEYAKILRVIDLMRVGASLMHVHAYES